MYFLIFGFINVFGLCFYRENYRILREYVKCILFALKWIVGLTINLINETHHLCERREYVFYILWKCSIITSFIEGQCYEVKGKTYSNQKSLKIGISWPCKFLLHGDIIDDVSCSHAWLFLHKGCHKIAYCLYKKRMQTI